MAKPVVVVSVPELVEEFRKLTRHLKEPDPALVESFKKMTEQLRGGNGLIIVVPTCHAKRSRTSLVADTGSDLGGESDSQAQAGTAGFNFARKKFRAKASSGGAGGAVSKDDRTSSSKSG
jgi:hypothetical protein